MHAQTLPRRRARHGASADHSRGLWGAGIAHTQFANGTIETALSPFYPLLALRFGLTLTTLGLVLTGIPIGLFLGGLVLGAPIARRLGSRAALLIGGALFFGLSPVAVLVPNELLLWLVLFAMGLGNSLFDIGWLLQSTTFEQGAERQHNQGVQVLFSVGSLCGATTAAIALGRHWPAVWTLLGVDGFALGALALWSPRFPASTRPPQDEAPTAGSVPGLRFAALCCAAFFAFFPLGVAYAWSTPYLQSLGGRAGLAALGLIAYTICEGLSRAAAWWISNRFSPSVIVLAGGVVALLGSLMIVSGRLPVAIAGFGLMALGFAPAGPIVQSAGNNLARRSVRHHERLVQLLTIAGYGGGVVGQPLIGWLAGVASLRFAMGLLVLGASLILALSKVAGGARDDRARPGYTVLVTRFVLPGSRELRFVLVAGRPYTRTGDGDLVPAEGCCLAFLDHYGAVIRTTGPLQREGSFERLQRVTGHGYLQPATVNSVRHYGRRRVVARPLEGWRIRIGSGRPTAIERGHGQISVLSAAGEGGRNGAFACELWSRPQPPRHANSDRDSRTTGKVGRYVRTWLWSLGLDACERAALRGSRRATSRTAVEAGVASVTLAVSWPLWALWPHMGSLTALAVGGFGVNRLIAVLGGLASRRPPYGRGSVRSVRMLLRFRLRWSPACVLVAGGPAAIVVWEATAGTAPVSPLDALLATVIGVGVLAAVGRRTVDAWRLLHTMELWK